MRETAATGAPLEPHARRWRARVFTATWLSYFGFYFCRKPFYVAKGTLEDAFGWNAELLAWVGVGYLVAYTAGQFIAGWAGQRWGPRLLVLIGMAVSIGANLAFGVTNSWGLFATFMILNGLAQATGWPGNVGSMAAWFTRRERGTVMGLWATNFQAGGVAANALAAWLLGAAGLKWSFFGGSIVLLLVWGYFVVNQRNRPEDVGLSPIEDPDEAPGTGAAEAPAGARTGWTRPVITNVILLGCFYFFVKFIRYALWSWAPYLLQRYFGLAGSEAGFVSTTFDVCGIAGVIGLGLASDRFFGGRRVGLSLVFILAMTASCGLLYSFGASSIVIFTICIGLIGFCLYGPDAILTSAGAIDVGSRRAATLAAGIINGMGSVGSVVQELIFGKVLAGGVAAHVSFVFGMLMASSIGAALCLSIVVWRNHTGRADL